MFMSAVHISTAIHSVFVENAHVHSPVFNRVRNSWMCCGVMGGFPQRSTQGAKVDGFCTDITEMHTVCQQEIVDGPLVEWTPAFLRQERLS